MDYYTIIFGGNLLLSLTNPLVKGIPLGMTNEMIEAGSVDVSLRPSFTPVRCGTQRHLRGSLTYTLSSLSQAITYGLLLFIGLTAVQLSRVRLI